MDRRKNGEEHSQLLNDSAFSENERDFFQPEDNSGFIETFDEDEMNGNQEIVLRNKPPVSSQEVWSPVENTKRYAEVFRCSYPLENTRKRWSDHTDFRVHSYNLTADPFNDDGIDDDAACDEMQTLLPKMEDSQEDLDNSRDSFISNSDPGEMAEDEESSIDSKASASSPPCDLGLVERLLRTHPVWFLPGIQVKFLL